MQHKSNLCNFKSARDESEERTAYRGGSGGQRLRFLFPLQVAGMRLGKRLRERKDEEGMAPAVGAAVLAT